MQRTGPGRTASISTPARPVVPGATLVIQPSSARVSLPFVFLLEVFVFEASLPEELDVQ